MNLKQKQKIVDKWIMNNGAANFNLKTRDILLYDGGLFSIEKETKYRPRSKLVPYKKGGVIGSELKEIKGPKVKYEEYKANLWFEELKETIRYLQRMERMLRSLGYNTGASLKLQERYKKKNV
jgi:hypothetical protein